jgi:hypothetical protein
MPRSRSAGRLRQRPQPFRRRRRVQGRRFRPRPRAAPRERSHGPARHVEQGGEVESIASDNKTIAFSSTFVSKNLFAPRIYTMDTKSGAIEEEDREPRAGADFHARRQEHRLT